MTKQTKVRRARKWLRDMQKVLPTAAPVYISARYTDPFGDCRRTRRGFEIRLDWTQPWDILAGFLLPHEYTHARVWGRLQSGNLDHDGHFWLELGVVTDASDIIPYHEHARN